LRFKEQETPLTLHEHDDDDDDDDDDNDDEHIFSSESPAVCELMWKSMLEPDGLQTTI